MPREPSGAAGPGRQGTDRRDPVAGTDGPTSRVERGTPRSGRPPRVGVLGGTFDPVHVGHLVVAQEARFALGLDRVLLVVANDPWQKTAQAPVTPAEDRLAVVQAAVDGVEGVEACRIEIDRGGPSYTVDTLQELQAAEPGAELYLIVGADVVPSLPTWHRADELPALATLVVARRAGTADVGDPAGWRVVHLPVPRLEVSSRDLRSRLAAGRPVGFLVPAAAIRCISSRGLYAGSR